MGECIVTKLGLCGDLGRDVLYLRNVLPKYIVIMTYIYIFVYLYINLFI
jgi:hypothetical protein